MKFLSTVALTFSGVCLLSGSVGAQRVAPTCHSFDGNTSEAALTYLQQERSILEPACIYDALGILDTNRYKPAIETLFHYLDFEKPEAPGAPHPVTMGPTAGAFPAADALARFGNSVLPKVKEVIRNDVEPPLSRLNAAKIYFDIRPEPATVGFIAKAGHEAIDPASSKQLIHFAQLTVNYCQPDKREECKKALDQ